MEEIELPNTKELEEEKEKSFTRRVALVTAIFAVALAITSLGGSKAMKEMLLAQQEASNQWAYYQAKVIREHLYRSQSLLLEAQLLERGSAMKPEVRGQIESLMKKASDEATRFAREKTAVEEEAKKVEHERDVYRGKDPYFEYGEVLLQIAIVMASIAILSASRPVFYFSLMSAAIGVILSANGFLMVFRLPFFH
ncbi:MAG TPA: DUF4337 domain-containing protein [Syntrophorhabdales bacterium]|nr:DUF4337 domain-containing protein [Syntrophorhabdales bacterium]